MILIAASNRDVASLNIKQQILRSYDFRIINDRFHDGPKYSINVDSKSVELVTLNYESTYAQDLPNSFSKLELVVFISRHSSVSGTPTLSVHTPGNLAEAKLGGISRKVSISPANAMRQALRTLISLKQEMHLDYEVSYEGTHHGPSLDVPTMFCELGSSPEQWNDAKAAEAVAHATIETIRTFGRFSAEAVVGIGGPHYNSRFTRTALESERAFGHIIPKYAVSGLDSTMLGQCVERTLESVEKVVLDWKGITGEDKQPLVHMLTEIGMRFERS